MMSRNRVFVACLVSPWLLQGVAACSPRDSPPPPVEMAAELVSPAGPGSGEPFLSAASDGTVLMSWLERVDTTWALRFSRLSGEAWSEPRTIAASSLFFVNWADFPSIIELRDGRLMAHWLGRSGPGRYSYDVWIAFSADGGATWSAPVRPHTDGTLSEHGFVTLFETGGEAGAVWLDGRKYAEAEANGTPTEMTLRFTTFAGSAPLPETLIDDRACDCCQTDVAVTDAGPVVIFRDRSPEEIRDIAVSRYIDGAWTGAVPVHEDGWQIAACPVNGPSIAASGRRVVAAWFTAARDTARVNVAFSSDAAATFGPPVRADLGNPVGRVETLLLGDGGAIVSWLERTQAGTRVMVRRISPAGAASAATVVGESSDARASGFPRMAAAGGRLVFAWTVPGEPAVIRVAVTPMPGVE